MPKILIFEDDTFLAGMYVTKFQMCGFEVAHYEHPTKNPVSIVLKEKPDLISMDIIMPVLNGFEATELLKKDDRTKKIPIVFLSNLSQKEDIDRGMNLGAAEYFVKAHIMPSELVQRYAEILGVPVPHQAKSITPPKLADFFPVQKSPAIKKETMQKESTVSANNEGLHEPRVQQRANQRGVYIPGWLLIVMVLLSAVGLWYVISAV